MHGMNTVKHIRTQVFKVSQAAFAEIAGANQSAVSRWEDDAKNFEPSRDEMDRIRSAAITRGLAWSDSLFFETPEAVSP